MTGARQNAAGAVGKRAQQFRQRLETKHGKGKSLSILSHKLGRAVYYVLKRREPFKQEAFFDEA